MDAKRKALKQKVVTFLNREEIDFLDKLGKDAWFSTGMKLSRTQIIEALVNLMMEMGVGGKGVDSKEELKQHILKALERFEGQ
ncbi:MAG: hypothetical protein KJ593_00865 [Candidatus Omnitrophica bacterium]|nr:hypothetical protein [Candidatus Omnitrophota bacterium]